MSEQLKLVNNSGKCVIRTKNHKWIDLDSASGGYPYETNDFERAHYFKNAEEAGRYMQNDAWSEQWEPTIMEIESITITYINRSDQIQKNSDYEQELMDLKAKYNIKS